MAMPTSGQSRNSSSSKTCRNICSVRSLKANCSMSTLTKRLVVARAQDWTEPVRNTSASACRVDGIELAVKRRKLDGKIHARQGTTVVGVNGVDRRPGVHLCREPINQLEVLGLVTLGFGLRDGCLAEQIDRESQALPSQVRDGCESFRDIGSCDETPGEPLRIPAGGAGHERPGPAVVRHPAQARLGPPREVISR